MELDDKFDSMNRTILEKVFDSVFKSDELVQAIANDAQFRDVLRGLGEDVQPALVKGKTFVTANVREIWRLSF